MGTRIFPGTRILSGWMALRISADEQVEFLRRLYQNDLPFSERSMEIVKEMMIQKSEPDLRGKTGSGFIENQHIGWFVGYQETDGHVYFFATNLTGPSPEIDGKKAREISTRILQDLNP